MREPCSPSIKWTLLIGVTNGFLWDFICSGRTNDYSGRSKTMTLAARSSSAQVNEASLALLLIDNTLDAIKAAASEGKGYTLLPSYEISLKAIDLAEEFLRKQCGYVIDNQNGVRTVYWFI